MRGGPQGGVVDHSGHPSAGTANSLVTDYNVGVNMMKGCSNLLGGNTGQSGIAQISSSISDKAGAGPSGNLFASMAPSTA